MCGVPICPGTMWWPPAAMNGKATVEKIAVNGVMAGCTPTHDAHSDRHRPGDGGPRDRQAGGVDLLQRGLAAHHRHQRGPSRKAIGINARRNFLSAYTRAQSCIARAMAYMIMNISGVRMQQEDMSGPGSDCRFGLCVAEDEEALPQSWPTLPAEPGPGRRG